MQVISKLKRKLKSILAAAGIAVDPSPASVAATAELVEILHAAGSKSDFHFDSLLYRVGLASIAAARAGYPAFTCLEQADFKVFSQFGEDGILDYLTTRLSLYKPTFVEIGTESYAESNTRFLFQRTTTKGLIIDCDPELKNKMAQVLGGYLIYGDLTAKSAFVSRDNILDLLVDDQQNWLDVDLLSLDIDGNDYWVMQALLPHCQHKIIVLEYNFIFGHELAVSTPYQPSFMRTRYHHSNLCFGASLPAFFDLMASGGYVFVGSNLFGNNGFWVRGDLFPTLGLQAPSREDLLRYTQCNCRESLDRSGALSYRSGAERLREIKDCLIVDVADSHPPTNGG